MNMKRYEITVLDDTEGYSPFMVDGVGVSMVIANGEGELRDRLREAEGYDVLVTWRRLEP